MNVFSFSLSGKFCVRWLILWQMAHFVGFPYLSKEFLPGLDCSLHVSSCLAILQIRLFHCGCVDVRCKNLGIWYGVLFFYDLVSVSVEESILVIVCATWGFCREFLILIIKIFTVIVKSLVLTMSYLSSPIVPLTNCSSGIVRFADFNKRYANRSSDHIVPCFFILR